MRVKRLLTAVSIVVAFGAGAVAGPSLLGSAASAAGSKTYHYTCGTGVGLDKGITIYNESVHTTTVKVTYATDEAKPDLTILGHHTGFVAIDHNEGVSVVLFSSKSPLFVYGYSNLSNDTTNIQNVSCTT